MNPTRRLGRGLGAFLDFGPSEEGGAARVAEAIAAPDAPSVLQVSAPPERPAAAPPPAPAPQTSPARSQPAPSLPEPEDASPFIDDVVVGRAFPDVDLE